MKILPVHVDLLCLLYAGDAYGREIIQRAAKQGERFTEGTVYVRCRDLLQEGLVASYISEPLPVRGGRRRTYYSLTIQGRDIVKQRLDFLQEQVSVLEASQQP